MITVYYDLYYIPNILYELSIYNHINNAIVLADLSFLLS